MKTNPHQFDPVRLPNWRARRAIYLVDHRPRPLRAARYDDEYIIEYCRYLNGLMAAEHEQQRKRTCSELPHVHRAHEFYYRVPLATRHVMEARLLTRESLNDIAKRVACETATVEHFEKLFFHVRDRLDCIDWVGKIIRGPRTTPPANSAAKWAAERRMLYCTIAYYGGPEALDVVTSGYESEEHPTSVADVVRRLEGMLRSSVQRHVMLGTSDLPLDPSALMRSLSRGCLRYR